MAAALVQADRALAAAGAVAVLLVIVRLVGQAAAQLLFSLVQLVQAAQQVVQ
jgi:hypothetical protein